MIDNKFEIRDYLKNETKVDVMLVRDYLMNNYMAKVYKGTLDDMEPVVSELMAKTHVMDKICIHSGVLQMQVVHPIGHYSRRGFQSGIIRTIHEFPTFGNLYGLLARLGNLDTELAKYLMTRLAGVVEHLHSHGVAHMQLATENIMVCDNYEIKVAKCEDAQNLVGTTQKVDQRNGLPGYIAPEVQDKRKRFDATKADVYSLGKILHEMVFGSTSCSDACPCKQHDKCCSNSQTFCDDTDSCQLANLINSMLNKDFKKRPSIQEVLTHPWLQDEAQVEAGCKKFEQSFEECIQAMAQ